MTTSTRPASGPAHYLRDLIYGASDGVVTTFAVVASVAGAALSARTAFIIGLGKLAADGLSMAAANYVALKSELGQSKADVRAEMPWRHALATFGAFVVAGGIPLLAFFLQRLVGWGMLPTAAVLAGLTLAVVGALRGPMMNGRRLVSALEMLVLGAAVGAAAYVVTLVTDSMLG